MCGRYLLKSSPTQVSEFFDLRIPIDPVAFQARYNIAPTQRAPIIRVLEPTPDRQEPAEEFDHRVCDWLRWGLVPSWAKNTTVGSRMINARSETVEHKPAFRSAFASRRCLVPSDGFYEWKKLESGKKQPFRIFEPQNELMAFAGLWERWRNKDGQIVESFAILTTDASPTIQPLHHRMPLILERDAFQNWLCGDVQEARQVLYKASHPLSATELEFYPVNPRLNRATEEGPELIDTFSLTTAEERSHSEGQEQRPKQTSLFDP